MKHNFDPMSFYVDPPPNSTIIYASALRIGEGKRRECVFKHFENECFIITEGLPINPNAGAAGLFAADTALWGYKHIRSNTNYWLNKTALLKRIFRTTNISLWQKQREQSYLNGLASTMQLVMFIDNKLWIGSVGDSRTYLFRNKGVTLLTKEDTNRNNKLTKYLGKDRYGLVPQVKWIFTSIEDTVILLSSSIWKNISPDLILYQLLSESGNNGESLQKSADKILDMTPKYKCNDDMIICILKRIPMDINKISILPI